MIPDSQGALPPYARLGFGRHGSGSNFWRGR